MGSNHAMRWQVYMSGMSVSRCLSLSRLSNTIASIIVKVSLLSKNVYFFAINLSISTKLPHLSIPALPPPPPLLGKSHLPLKTSSQVGMVLLSQWIMDNKTTFTVTYHNAFTAIGTMIQRICSVIPVLGFCLEQDVLIWYWSYLRYVTRFNVFLLVRMSSLCNTQCQPWRMVHLKPKPTKVLPANLAQVEMRKVRTRVKMSTRILGVHIQEHLPAKAKPLTIHTVLPPSGDFGPALPFVI